MKVFLGWSGDISQAIALELREWLPSVIQNIDSWISSEDIRKGVPWGPALAKQLAEARAGVFCLTHENFTEPWINFEAGAVSNTAWAANVCTYLFDIASSGITGPLTQFQWTIATNKKDNLRLLTTINSAQAEGALDKQRLERAFEKYWPELEAKLTKISDAKHPKASKRSVEDMVEETLNRVRDLQKQSASQPTSSELKYIVDSSALANYPVGYPMSSGNLLGIGAATQGAAFVPGGTHTGLVRNYDPDPGKLYPPREKLEPAPTIRPRPITKPTKK